jgi:hypothetical protein
LFARPPRNIFGDPPLALRERGEGAYRDPC